MRQAGTIAVRLMLAAALAVAGLAGCRSQREESPPDTRQYARIELTSTAFGDGQPIPMKYTGEGEDVSPSLWWSALPEGTKELALICDDPDAPRAEPWVHWVIYAIPAAATGLPEDFDHTDRIEGELTGLVEGKNSFGNTGYGGPMPPPGHGKHRYFFKLYALDSQLALEPRLDKNSLLKAIQGHVLGRGELMGTYQR